MASQVATSYPNMTLGQAYSSHTEQAHSSHTGQAQPVQPVIPEFIPDESEQPPDNWPPDVDENWKAEHSPLSWRFTEEQNKRKLNWFKRVNEMEVVNGKLTNATELVKSFIASDVVRKGWFGPGQQPKRDIKVKDFYRLLHTDHVARDFVDADNVYKVSLEQIKRLHEEVFSSEYEARFLCSSY